MLHKITISLLLLPIFLKGFGSTTIFAITVLVALVYIFHLCESKNKKIFLGIFTICLASGAISVIHIWSVLGFVLMFEQRTRGFAIIALALSALDLVFPPTTFLFLLIVYLVGLFLNFTPIKYTKGANILIAIIALSVTIVDIGLLVVKPPLKVEKYDVHSIYSPSDLFCKTTNSAYSSSSKDSLVLRSLMFNPAIAKETRGIVIHEIDTQDPYNLTTHSYWQQPTSWHENQLLGSQYLLEAICKDGGLYSNKGVAFKKKGKITLTCPSSFNTSQPLIILLDGIIHLHDSDYTSSYLANYQKCLNNELVKNSMRPFLIRVISLLAIICSLFLLFTISVKPFCILLWTLFLSQFLALYFLPRKGDIRIIGKITNSHENFKYDGVTKNIVATGYNYTIGELGAKVLLVSSGSHAIWLGEPVVILEPNATLFYKTNIISSDDIPYGYHQHVSDARMFFYKGNKYLGYHEIENVQIIATGSPAKIQWQNLLR